MKKYCHIIKIDTFTTNDLFSLYSDKSIKNIISDLLNNISSNKIFDKTVLIKPNWVLDNRNNNDDYCLRTNEIIIINILEHIISKKPKLIIIGDAPIQGCKWEKLFSHDFLKSIDYLRSSSGINIFIKDFRRRTFNCQENKVTQDINPISNYVIFDIGNKSFLTPITKSKKFRVTNYNPDKLYDSHNNNSHKYCIVKELFIADLVISVPKIKTHQKTGITCALKNLVGLNGDKDFLPHHRIGGSKMGGDCYPGRNVIRYLSEITLDAANRRQGSYKYKLLVFLSSVLWKLSFPKKVHQIAGGWYGNDTTWRMVMDLNLISRYGDKNGNILSTKQRDIFSLCDGIIAGQGDGPLNPEILKLGVISFTNDSGLNDLCISQLLGFDYKKIPLLSNLNYDLQSDDYMITYNNIHISFNELKNYSVKTTPPPGWINNIEL